MSAQSVECISTVVRALLGGRAGVVWVLPTATGAPSRGTELPLLPLPASCAQQQLAAAAPGLAFPLAAQVSRWELPDWVLTTFLSNCMQDTSSCQVQPVGQGWPGACPGRLGGWSGACLLAARAPASHAKPAFLFAPAKQDAGRQSRQVKLLCACVGLVLQRQPASLAEALPELLSFCIQARGRRFAAGQWLCGQGREGKKASRAVGPDVRRQGREQGPGRSRSLVLSRPHLCSIRGTSRLQTCIGSCVTWASERPALPSHVRQPPAAHWPLTSTVPLCFSPVPVHFIPYLFRCWPV